MSRGDKERGPEKGPYKGRGRLKGSRICRYISQSSGHAILGSVGDATSSWNAVPRERFRGSKHLVPVGNHPQKGASEEGREMGPTGMGS